MNGSTPLTISLRRETFAGGTDGLVGGGGGETQVGGSAVEFAGLGMMPILASSAISAQQSPDLALTHTYSAPEGICAE